MSAAPQTETSVWSMYRAIVGIGLLCALLIVGVYEATYARIRINEARFLARAVADVLPVAQSTRAVTVTGGKLVPLPEAGDMPVLLGYDADGALAGAVIAAEGMGYADNIRVLYAYSFAQQAITGFKVLASKETPGLGDRIETEAHFVANFERLDARLNADGTGLANPIVTVKQGAKTEPWQLDGITGATITSVAIGQILNDSGNQWLPVLEAQAVSIPAAPADGGT